MTSGTAKEVSTRSLVLKFLTELRTAFDAPDVLMVSGGAMMVTLFFLCAARGERVLRSPSESSEGDDKIDF